MPKETITEITIHLHESDDGSIHFEIYKGSPEDQFNVGDLLLIGGGACTTNMKNAIEMAADLASERIKKIHNS